MLQLDTTLPAPERADPESESPATTGAVRGAVAQLADDVEFALLPELWTVGAFNADGFIESAQTLDGDHVAAMSDLARAAGIWLHAGSFIERNEDQFFNTSIVFDSAGNLVAHYRKVHLFGFGSGEARILESGPGPVVLDTPLGRTGLSTCYDLRFPELYRAERALGAEVFVIPTGWPMVRVGVWRALAVARSLENQAWLVGCNGVGSNGGVQLGGTSVVVDPDGRVIAEGSADQPETITADVDPLAARELRAAFPVHDDRRLLPDG